MSIEVHQAHDSYIRRMLSDLEVAKSLMKSHLPSDIVKRVDWESLQLTNKSFVSEELQQFHSDIIYKCTIDKSQGYIYHLVEHQSSPDEWLPLRMLEYNVLLMRQHIEEGNKKLPIIINTCIYAGKKSPYPYSNDIYDCFEDVELAKERMFKPFHLTDLTILSQEELLKEGSAGLVKVLLKQGIKRDYLKWIKENRETLKKMVGGLFGISSVIYILGTDDINDPGELFEAILQVAPDKKDLIMTALQKLEHKSMQQGIQQGMQQGKVDIAKNMLKEGSDVGFVQKITGLTKEIIETLKQE